jgi:hypothetical protein
MEALGAVDRNRRVHRSRDLEHCHAGNLQVGAFECAAIPRNFVGWDAQAEISASMNFTNNQRTNWGCIAGPTRILPHCSHRDDVRRRRL